MRLVADAKDDLRRIGEGEILVPWVPRGKTRLWEFRSNLMRDMPTLPCHHLHHLSSVVAPNEITLETLKGGGWFIKGDAEERSRG